MIRNYVYNLGDIVWTLQNETNIVESWIVKQVLINVTSDAIDGTVVKYVLAGKRGSFKFLESDMYETIADALNAIP